MLAMDFPGAKLASHDEEFGYRIYRLDQPMAPGETRQLSFHTRRWQRGFRNSGSDTRLVANGTFLNNIEIAPAIGMDRMGLLQDRAKRRKYGLEAELRPAKLEDISATAKAILAAAGRPRTSPCRRLPTRPRSRPARKLRIARRMAAGPRVSSPMLRS
jgi:hypothetical protein